MLGLSSSEMSLCQALVCIVWAESCLCYFYFIPCALSLWQTSSHRPAFAQALMPVARWKLASEENQNKLTF